MASVPTPLGVLLGGDPAACWCRQCQDDRGVSIFRRGMILCATCGNKRCPHATSHRNACTNSNEPGQAGSDYA